MTELKLSESISVAVAPDELYALVSDVTRMGDWSPVCRACWWDEGAGPEVGAWFTGRNEIPERTWETRCKIIAADPGQEFAWEVNRGWVRWGYTFESEDGGTRLTESWEFLPAGIAGFRERFRRAGRCADRHSARGGQEWYPGHAGGDQEGRRSRLIQNAPATPNANRGIGRGRHEILNEAEKDRVHRHIGHWLTQILDR